MSTVEEFDVFGCELGGVNLIEASAGTGKTWNICGLYLRLLLERGLSVQQILVVTFTNAATAELRERIRARIVETLAYLRGNGTAAGADPFVPALVAAVERRSGRDGADLVPPLDAALQFFDEAAIFTIHGFCQRALADASFSAGLPFSLELVADDREMAMEAVHDFWRRRIAGADCPPALAAFLLRKKDTPEKYAKLLARSLGKPLARPLWPAGIDAPVKTAPSAGTAGTAGTAAPVIDTTALSTACDAAARLWAAQRDGIVALVVSSLPALNGTTYKAASVEQAACDWDAWFAEGSALAPVPEKSKLGLLSSGTLERRKNKNRTPPAHPFFDAAQALLDAQQALATSLELARMGLLRELLDIVVPELRRRKRERRVISFSDMLWNLHAAFGDGDHPGLAASLRERFPVALVDEFQDTDPLQFSIFDQIHGGTGAPVFLVGDPKQAIYSFRHADLHAYLDARRHASRVWTLAASQRSTQGLIAALNGLFSVRPDAFMLPGLDYHAVTMGTKLRAPLVDRTEKRADLELWKLPRTPAGEPILKKEAKARAAQATAAEIARLVAAGHAGRITIGERALRPGDIAVLVRTHAQGSEIKQALAMLDVGSVELSQASVFRTRDAEEVERVLIAINEPSRDTLLRAALATEMLGCDAAGIAAISADEAALTGWLGRFSAWRELWLRHGVGVMYRRLLAEQKVGARMLARPDGERRLTNLLHLGEQIHQAAATHESPDALLRWLASRRSDDAVDEVAQLRLESDRNLVQIVTIHKAKGLEFPIVFCPYLWEGTSARRRNGNKPEGREYHDDDGTAVVDFRSDDELGARKAAIDRQIRLEEAAEGLRLVYVALTRAIHRCYVIAGAYAINAGRGVSTLESTRALLNWLVASGSETPQAWLDAERPPAEITAAWEAFAGRLAPHVALAPLPEGPGTPVARSGPAPETLAALPAPKTIAPAWRFGSFTGLASGAQGEAAANDHDARIAEAGRRIGPPPSDLAPDDILRFPRGPAAGDCLHAIFERIDFTDRSGWSNAIERALAAHPQAGPGARAAGQAPALAAMAARMLGDVLATTLPGGIVLGAIPGARRLSELEFSLPAPRVSASALNDALKRIGCDVPRLAFRDLEGYLKGFIDLVFEHDGRFYLLDWKSNHLGYAPSDYAPAALQSAMAEHSYHLQYLLYALALDRYLRRRVPGYRADAHFGGVLYLFVRGVRPDWVNPDGTPAGVFHHRPVPAALARLDALFSDARASAMR